MTRILSTVALLVILSLAGCGTPVAGGLLFHTADPALSIFVPVPQPPVPVMAPAIVPTPICNIKVNFNGTEWIYHLPGQVSYLRTLVEPAKGEAFVCTEQEALDMGARKSLR